MLRGNGRPFGEDLDIAEDTGDKTATGEASAAVRLCPSSTASAGMESFPFPLTVWRASNNQYESDYDREETERSCLIFQRTGSSEFQDGRSLCSCRSPGVELKDCGLLWWSCNQSDIIIC